MSNRTVLHIVLRWQSGGVESFVRTLVNCEELGHYDQLVYSFFDCRMIDPAKTTSIRNYDDVIPAAMLSAVAVLKKTLRDVSPDVVHVHTNNGLGLFIVSAAQKEGVPLCIAHAHNSSLGYGSGKSKKIANGLLMKLFGRGSYSRVACSCAAGDYLFGGKEYSVLNNSIDVDRFRFSSEKRDSVRRQLLIENRLVLGCCGSLIPAKNVGRLISLMPCLLEKEPNAILIIVGGGPDELALRVLADESKVSEQVIFAGKVEDPSAFYNAFDVLVMPSLYEGLPLSAVEAQANGLSLVLSDSITKEVDISGDCAFVSLSEKDEIWAEVILSKVREPNPISREDRYMNAVRHGYDKTRLISEISRMWSR